MHSSDVRRKFIQTAFAVVITIAVIAYFWFPVLWSIVIIGPVILCGIYDIIQKKHTLMRNYPVIGRGRWMAEMLRPPIQQYFVENEVDGAPINRMFRSVVYQRAKKVLDSVPFGTQADVYRVGYEWLGHSLTAIAEANSKINVRFKVGGPRCTIPYTASILNISAMSYGSLGSNAILALNGGAKLGNFAHNTGEGGISKYHLANDGDLVWQVGTGYFGCRTKDGKFCADSFKENATKESVRMIEIKLSQGAKPGHGGILPAVKNTPEIAEIRHVEPFTRVDSPPAHSSFDSPLGLMKFIQQLRELSGGKPIGFKICIGRPEEFVAICQAMVETGISPDFITVDGGEGGTGAAPLEFTNSIGMPLRDGLAFVVDCLNGFDLKKNIIVIASGKVLTGFHLVKNLALGADLCNSARAMMLALGCIQARVCNTNLCPTGVATQNKDLASGLDVADKRVRVANYQAETVKAVKEMIASMGFGCVGKLKREHIFRRVSATQIMTYEDIYPSITPGAFLKGDIPEPYAKYFVDTTPTSFTNDNRSCVLRQ